MLILPPHWVMNTHLTETDETQWEQIILKISSQPWLAESRGQQHRACPPASSAARLKVLSLFHPEVGRLWAHLLFLFSPRAENGLGGNQKSSIARGERSVRSHLSGRESSSVGRSHARVFTRRLRLPLHQRVGGECEWSEQRRYGS